MTEISAEPGKNWREKGAMEAGITKRAGRYTRRVPFIQI